MVEQIITKKGIGKLLLLDYSAAKAHRNDNSDSLSSLRATRGNPKGFIHNLFFILFLIFLLTTIPAQAFDKPIEQNYFASLRSTETNIRSGPGSNYPIKFTFKLRGLPVKVISEYDNWCEIKDYDGDNGWVNQNLLTKKRMVVVKTAKTFIDMHSAASQKSKIILRLENNVVADFIKCSNNWCGIKVAGKKGWVEKEDLWGVDEND